MEVKRDSSGARSFMSGGCRLRLNGKVVILICILFRRHDRDATVATAALRGRRYGVGGGATGSDRARWLIQCMNRVSRGRFSCLKWPFSHRNGPSKYSSTQESEQNEVRILPRHFLRDPALVIPACLWRDSGGERGGWIPP